MEEKLASLTLRTSSLLDERQVAIIVLLAQVCSLYDATPKTFVINILRLHRVGVIEQIDFLQDLGLLPTPSSSNATMSTTVAAESLLIMGMNDPDIYDFTANQTLNVSRYQREFQEMRVLGRGSFGSVYLSKNLMDGHVYAIKCVNFHNKGYRDHMVQAVLREVKCLAQCDHRNVNRYYAAWLEPTWLKNNKNSNSADNRERNWKYAHSNPRLLRDIHNMVERSSENEEVSAKDLFYKYEFSKDEGFEYMSFEGSTNLSQCSSSTSSTSKRFSETLSSSSSGVNEHFVRNFRSEESLSSRNALDVVDAKNPMAIPELETGAAPPCKFSYEITLYIQMALCDQLTLRDFIDSRNVSDQEVDVEYSINLFRQLVEGLAHVHSKGIVHRDLKPENIFLGKDGCLQIGDFGLSKLIRDACQSTGSPMNSPSNVCTEANEIHTAGVGTLAYASPEQLQGQACDSPADSYSCYGRLALKWRGQSPYREHPKLPPEFVAQFPDVASLINSLVSFRADVRPTAAQLLDHSLLEHAEVSILLSRIKKQAKIIAEQKEKIRLLEDEVSRLTRH